MQTKSLLFGISGFILGGLVVSIAATSFNKPATPTMNDMTMSQMTDLLKDKKGDDYDKAFIEMMIAHHQSAVDMAMLSKANAKHDEIKNLSNDILSAQTKEITQMQKWQMDWAYGSMQMNHNMHM